MQEQDSHQWEDEDQFDLLDLLIVLAKRKRFIIGITFGAAALMVVISLLMPAVYRAETRILSPQTSSSMATQLLNQMGGASALLGGSLGIKSPDLLYIEMLKSRPVLDRIIDRYGLMKLYDAETREDARLSLKENLFAKNDMKSGVITVGVEDRDPERAAGMANAFIEELRTVNKGLSITEAAQRRLFFEEQMRDTKAALTKAEEAMKGFQERSGAVQIEAQAGAVIEGISQLKAQIAAKEVQIRVMRTYSTPQNPDILRAEEELKGMGAQLGKLESKSKGGSVIVSTGNLPSAGMEYVRRMRDLKFNETFYELLQSQYQAARLDEARDATVIQVMEKAVPPEKKAKPRRILLVMVAMIAGFFIALCGAFFLEFRERAKSDPESSEKLERLKRHLTIRGNEGG
ncbi:MAG: Wzz/FepE/Etk N-terminal domain-containing protein [Syntrophaceae bacterium]|nr:hypothetical protein [Deltaproteobacteria bacterium]